MTSMKRPATAWLVFGLTALCLTVATLLPDNDWPLNAILFVGVALLFASLCGALIGHRRPDNAVGWILLAIALSVAAGLAATQWANRALVDRPGSLPAGIPAAWLQSWLWAPLTGLFPLLVLWFPTGRVPSGRWRVVLWLTVAATVVPALTIAFRPGPFDTFKHIDNPLGVDILPVDLLQVLAGAWLLTVPAAVLSLFLRFRKASGVERQQIKWFFLAAVSAVVLVLLNPLIYALNANADPAIFGLHLGLIFPVFAFALLPAAIALAVLRYRLFDIDRIISRTLSYAIVTALLATTFILVVLVPTGVVGATGKTPDWLVAVATLVVAALFRPVRWRVQNAIDHRFNRRRYDAERTIDAFTARMREQTEVEGLQADLESLVTQTMQPVSVSLWITPPRNRGTTAS